ncbi:MAG: flippase-like domain-containing protein [SAR324 cluster bacterium]|nr:flippase-like domain-containing protein [SAR324 cluster bacterium]
MKRIIINILKFGFVAGILYYLIASDRLNFERLLLFWENPSVLITMVGLLVFWIVPLAALRWWFLLRAIGLEVPLTRASLLTWIGNFFNTTLPGAVSGDVIKGYYIIRSQEKEGKTRAFTTLLIDRFVGLFGLIVMAFFALIFNLNWILSKPALASLAGMIGGLFAGTVIFYAIVLYPFKEGKDPFLRLFKKLPGHSITVKVYLAFKSFQHQKPTLLITLLMSIVLHITVAFLFFLVAQMIEVSDLNIFTQFFIMPIGLITIAIPVAPGGVGVGHVAFESLYKLVGISGGADIFNLYVIIQLAVYLLGGIPYLIHSGEYHIPQENEIGMEEQETEAEDKVGEEPTNQENASTA